MKRFFLIPLLTLMCSVMAWGDPTEVSTESELSTALLSTGGEIKLKNDIEVSGMLLAVSAFTLDLNGKTLSSDEPIILMTYYTDATITNGTVTSMSITYAPVLFSNVTINATGNLAALSINEDASITMAGSTINGRVNVGSNASFIMNSGTIIGDSQVGVQVEYMGNFTMNGGTINDEKVGVLVYNGGSFTMENGTINVTGNGSESYYGVYVDGTINYEFALNNGYNTPEAIRANYQVSTAAINGGTIAATGNIGCAVSVWRGATLNVTGGTLTGSIYGITGNGSAYKGGTNISISGGSITGTDGVGIYHPQQENSTLTITDGNITGHNSAIEMRAGTLDIDGGNFTATATEFLNVANNSGTTTMGAALAVAQHTTLQPISIDISGGIFRGIYPIAQANPQENAQEFIDHVNIAVSGGQFWATNTADVAAYTENNKLSLTGGYYNLAPHAFVANGYVAINNPDEDPLPTVEDGYLFKVVQLEPETFESTLTEGNWVVEDTWQDNPSVSAQIPTQQSNVTIPNGGNVFVQPTGSDAEVVAYAHNLTLEANANLTVKDGATLVLGNEANVDDNANLVVEAGGQLLIAPSETAVHPVGTVTLIADAAGLKQEGLDDSDPNNLYWQHFAIPTTEAPSIRVEDKNGQEITDPITYYNTWDIVNGWENVLKTDMNTPFQGYNLSNDRVYGSNIRYIFSGPLVGNASNPLVFARRGFSFFGNSYLAPINIRALQAAMYEQGMEYTVYVYVHRNASGPQIYRAINDVTAGIYGIDEIKPLEGFFMFAEEASQADFQYNSAVYSAFLNKQMGGNMVNNAPARNAKHAFDAKAVIAVEAQNGESDEVILVASENFSNDYDLKADARKMENSGMNIYADGAFDDLAVMATNDLMGQTLSFKAGKDALYTMTFSNVEGELALYDNEVNQTISIAEGSTYTFAAQPNSTVNGRFEIVPMAKVPTAIENTEVKANAKGIYSITGMYLGENFNALPAGVYVVNGVKIVK